MNDKITRSVSRNGDKPPKGVPAGRHSGDSTERVGASRAHSPDVPTQTPMGGTGRFWPIRRGMCTGGGSLRQTMPLARIASMPVRTLAAADAHLWLWVTNATLRQGYDVAEAWGFTVRSPLTWVKFRLGLGPYLRNATEHVLFATRGKGASALPVAADVDRRTRRGT